jgi:hypothetical protein
MFSIAVGMLQSGKTAAEIQVFLVQYLAISTPDMSCDEAIDLVGKVMEVFCENVLDAPVPVDHVPPPASDAITEKTHASVKVLSAEEYKAELEKRKAAVTADEQYG